MDNFYMELALKEAEKGKGKVNPNPLVGAVIVKNNEIIGIGHHEVYGGPHAEINAFNNATSSVEGATMYVTLEPCSHYGKTPPCADKIIEKKLSRVVIGTKDPNELVAGKGVKKLLDAGIEVTIGVLEEECKKINEVFIRYITTKRPFVVLKVGMSLDGKICTSSGESKWITSEKSRENVHLLRNELKGIMVGVNTVIKDNPKLTCRIENARNPVRIIVDSTLRIPLDSYVVESAREIKTIIGTTEKADINALKFLEAKGVTIIKTESINGKVNLDELLMKLGELSIDSILLEGGAKLNYSALESGIVQKVLFYISPKIIGGDTSKTPVGGSGIDKLKDAFKIKKLSFKAIDEDILIEGYLGGD